MAGITENISRAGMAVRIPAVQGLLPLVGDYCDIYLELPKHPRTEKRCLHCRSLIAWTMQIGTSEIRIGLSVGSMTFKDFPVTRESCSTDEENERTLLM